MKSGSKKNLFGILVDAADYRGATERILGAAAEGRPLAVSATAVHGLMTAFLDPEQRFRLNRFDLVLPDGQPVRWALNLLHGAGLTDRVYGPTLTLELCRQAAQRELPVYFYGSRPEVLKPLLDNLKKRFPSLMVAGSSPSLFRRTSVDERVEIAGRIKASGAALVFVGLGCPRQEVWAYEYRELISCPLIAVGAAFDFHAGMLPQAPPLLQRFGLEWLFRLIQEPRRLWKRYLTLNPLFLLLLAVQGFFGQRFFAGRAESSPRLELYG